MDENKTLIDILFDEENVDGITLRLDDGQEVDFEQIATIPLKSGANYAILKPTVELEGVADDEVMIFRIIDENGGRLEFIKFVEGKSTTSTIAKINAQK